VHPAGFVVPGEIKERIAIRCFSQKRRKPKEACDVMWVTLTDSAANDRVSPMVHSADLNPDQESNERRNQIIMRY